MSTHVQNDRPVNVIRSYMREKEAANYLCICHSQLRKLRAKNKGPVCRPHPGGRGVIYSVADLDAWILREPILCDGTGREPRAA